MIDWFCVERGGSVGWEEREEAKLNSKKSTKEVGRD